VKKPEKPEKPEISVIFPTYGRAGRLPGLLQALEGQTLSSDRFEVVVVDDCSTDGTAAVIEKLGPGLRYRLRPLRTPVNGGPAAARNLGWRQAEAPLLAFLDDDCLPEPGWLEAGLAALTAQPGAGVIQGRTHMTNLADQRKHAYGAPNWEVFHTIDHPTPFFESCNIFYRREVMEATGGFDEAIGWFGEDTAAGWKALDAGWDRGFASEAVVTHPVERRGYRWFMRNGLLERNIIGLASVHPGFRAEAFWRPWAYRKEDAAFKVAVLGALLGLRFRPALLLVIPYVWWQRPSLRQRSFWRLCLQIPAVDAARSLGQIRGAVAHRVKMV